MDLEILKIASNTENHKVIKNCTHSSKNKNPLCGDEMQISLIVEENKIIEFGYQCRSCIYCQASVSLLSQKVIKLSIDKISKLISNAELLFDKSFDQSKIDELNDLKKIINPKNISRKECLLLPFKTLSKALNL
ncbi:iron-sulfur cluster assembly scaffold protein [Candidatus Pelagibacter sp.]|nr:iron-sulfur cluster assembly scaffold protein [Candidatus Pelagibacter sp.]